MAAVAEVLEAAEGGGREGARPRPSVEARAPIRTASVSSVARARSFGALRGFARVGGVLIGRDPEDGAPALDFRSFEWTRDGGTLRFHFVAADGSAVDAGPFHASAVHGALAYAADGRALTGTMISAQPLPDLKILLHPALLDTSLGCRAISIDRFADESTGRDQYPERAQAERGFHADVMLYEIARAAVIDALPLTLKQEEADFRENTTARAHGLIALTTSTSGNEGSEVLDLIASEIKGKTASGLHRFDHFNRDVVSVVEACMGPTKSPQDFVACTRDRGKQYVGSGQSESDYEKIGAASLPVPTFQIWSGVREAPYRPDATLSFLRQPGDSSLQFMVQVAFTSPPFQKLVQEGRTKLEDGDEQSDPLEFSSSQDFRESPRDGCGQSGEKRRVRRDRRIHGPAAAVPSRIRRRAWQPLSDRTVDRAWIRHEWRCEAAKYAAVESDAQRASLSF